MCEYLAPTIFTLILFFSNILLIVMAGVGYSYFNSDVLISNYQINLKLLFGFGIGVGILELFCVLIFLIFTEFRPNYFITVGIFIIISSLFIVYTRPNYYKKYVDYYNKVWDENSTKIIDFQWTRSCCGYNSFKDRSIPNCPFEFTSGCSSIISDYLQTRFNEIFVASIVTLCLFMISMIFLIIYGIIEDVSSIFEDVYILNEIF